jgi:hypothetical protein
MKVRAANIEHRPRRGTSTMAKFKQIMAHQSALELISNTSVPRHRETDQYRRHDHA